MATNTGGLKDHLYGALWQCAKFPAGYFWQTDCMAELANKGYVEKDPRWPLADPPAYRITGTGRALLKSCEPEMYHAQACVNGWDS
jgi:hypothetical protein